jgi:diadenosine tetraphosphate (Ap4A) HIT family hydrolase
VPFPHPALAPAADDFDTLDDALSALAGFVSVIQLCVTAMRLVTSCDRVNIAILGDREPHLHAHLIPRLKSDPMPKDAPWLDSRPKRPLDREREEAIVAAYITTLKHLEH